MKITPKKILLLLLTAIIIGGFYFLSKDNNDYQISTQTPTPTPQNSEFATVISTNPPDLENTIIIPSQTVDITFSDPIVNTDELKHTMDPEGGYTLKLSFDRKTLSIIPNPSFKLGTGYIFTIKSDMTKFDNGKKLQSDINYHFNTIVYHGV